MKLIVLISCLSISFITMAASLLHQQEMARPDNSATFVRFRISLHENKLIRTIPHSKFAVTMKEYSNFKECTNAIADVMAFNIIEISPVITNIPVLINSLKLYIGFILKFKELKEKCVSTIKTEIPTIDITKVVSDLVFNKEILLKLIHADKYFVECLTKFSYLVPRERNSTFINHLSLEFMQEYVEDLYEELFGSLILVHTIKDFKEFKIDRRNDFERMIDMFLSSFNVFIFKQAINIFILVLKEESIDGTKYLVVREELRNFGVYGDYLSRNNGLIGPISFFAAGVDNLRVAKVMAKNIKPHRWKNFFISDTIDVMGKLMQTLFDIVAKI
eukprot:GAHX01002717.1.p1 GENE.GAHX01002717.1~~GAHX01002717.1.p1  ORF type:complete len:332 (+),score=39.04 GAHX01002717.1:180-1175(+)